MNEWISVKDRLPVNHREVWFVRRQARGRPIVVRGFRDSDRWQDATNNIKIEQHDVSFWQYIVVPEPPKPEGPFVHCWPCLSCPSMCWYGYPPCSSEPSKSEGPFYVGPTFGRWCILHEKEKGYRDEGVYPLKHCVLKEAQRTCDYLNYLWAKHMP